MAPRSIQDTPIENLATNPQVRHQFDEESINGLAQSIRELGILQPLYARRHADSLVIIDGERRYRAAKKVGLATVPVIIEEKEMQAGDILHVQLVTNCQREDLAPLEKAKAIARLMKATGWSPTQAAGKLGIPNSTITRSLAILSLPPTIRQHVQLGQIPASAAYDLARIKDPQQQAEFAKRLVERNLTRDALAGAIKAQKRTSPDAARTGVMRTTLILGPGRTVTVTDEQLDLDKLIVAMEELLAKARKARTQGIELGTFTRMLKDQTKA